MAKGKLAILALVGLWAALVVASFVATANIDGPRNMDTGFRRLDVLVRYQIVAFGVAVLAAAAGFVWRLDGRRMLLLGLLPLIVTGLLVGGIAVVTLVLDPASGPAETGTPVMPATAPAPGAVKP